MSRSSIITFRTAGTQVLPGGHVIPASESVRAAGHVSAEGATKIAARRGAVAGTPVSITHRDSYAHGQKPFTARRFDATA